MTRILIRVTIVCSAMLLFGCSSVNRMYNQTDNNAVSAKAQLQNTKATASAIAPAVVTNAGYYASATPLDSEHQPAWLRRHISLQAHGLPFSLLANRVLRNTGTQVNYAGTIKQDMTISMHYRGTIKGALDELAAKSKYAYSIDHTQLNWSAFITKTFDIAFMPGASTYLVGQTTGNNNTAKSSSSSSSSSSIDTVRGNLDDQQYTGLSATLSVWKDIKQTLDELKSPDGKYFVSESTTSVTVHDHPANMAAIANYIKQLNRDLSKQVNLKVQVLEIDLNQQQQYGINWNLVQGWLGTKFRLLGSLYDNAAITSSATLAPASLGIGDTNGSNVLLQALSQQGKLSVVTEPSLTTLNNQVAEIRISTDTGYLKEVSQSTFNQAGSSTVSLTPGIVTDGFSLYLLPKIQNNRVYLQISSSLSNLKAIKEVDSGIGAQGDKQVAARIQVPTLAEKRFNMRSVVPNGGTLIIAGFKQLRNETRRSQMFGSQALGGQAANNENVETIVLITPSIIENNS